jgi:ribosome-associated toxin RatA of RatAB toxin-antitoxin module
MMLPLKLHFSECIPGSAGAIFERIVDVGSYPSFLPYCQKAEVRAIDETEFRARLWLSKGWISLSFESHVRLEPFQNIYMSSESGPFRSLQGFWKLTEKSESETDVELSLTIDFFSYWQKQMLMPFASVVAKELIGAFVYQFSPKILKVHPDLEA